jgi:hypothetical protein
MQLYLLGHKASALFSAKRRRKIWVVRIVERQQAGVHRRILFRMAVASLVRPPVRKVWVHQTRHIRRLRIPGKVAPTSLISGEWSRSQWCRVSCYVMDVGCIAQRRLLTKSHICARCRIADRAARCRNIRRDSERGQQC